MSEQGGSKERNQALQAIYQQAETLKSLAYEDPNFDSRSGRNQYLTLRAKLLQYDKSAGDHLPDQYQVDASRYDEDASRSSVRIAVSQLCSYIDAKFVEHPKEPEKQTIAGPVANFLMMLPTYGLTVKWAVAAAMLSSLEIMTNLNLSKLKIPFDPNESFDKRLNKLHSDLSSKGKVIPVLLLSGLYKVRNKVIHEGKEPTDEEMTTIYGLLESLHEKTK